MSDPVALALPAGGLSILLPVQAGAALPELYVAVTTACEQLGRPHELLFIDDGTRDGSGAILDLLVEEDPRVRVVHLRRPLGRPVALTTGFPRARGDIVVTLEPDDDDPHMIADFVARIDAGADLVTGWRQRPGVGADLRSRLLHRLADLEFHDPSCGLRAYRRSLLLALPHPPGGERFLPLLAHTQGFRVEELVVHPRGPGRKNDQGGLLAALADLLQIVLLTRHPHRPLRLLAVPGLLLACAGLLLLVLGALVGSFLLMLGLVATIVGAQLVIAGLLAEQIASAREPAHYAIRDEREASDETRAAFLVALASDGPRTITASHIATRLVTGNHATTGNLGNHLATGIAAAAPVPQPGVAVVSSATPFPDAPHRDAPHPGYTTVHPTTATPTTATTAPTRTVVAPVAPDLLATHTVERPTRTAPAPVLPPAPNFSIEEDDDYDDGPATVAVDRIPYPPR